MTKLKSLDELKKIRQDSLEKTNLRTNAENSERIVVSIGMATCGIAAGARVTLSALLDEVKNNNLQNVSVISTGCLGHCYAEPMVEVKFPNEQIVRYKNVGADLARQIITKHIMHGELINEAVLTREV